MSKVRLRKLACDDIDGVIALLKDDCDITRNSDIPEVVVTGNGGNRNRKKLEMELNIKLKIVSEYEMAVDGTLLLLKTMEEPFLPLAEDPQNKAIESFKLLRGFVASSSDGVRQKWQMMQDLEETISWKPELKITFPFLLVTCGSAFGYDKIYQDGTFERVDFSLFGGRSLLALLALLTKERDFDKLVSMASSSDGRSVDVYGSDLALKDEEDEIYSSLADDLLVFPFGKVNSNSDVKTGDMAHGLLKVMCMNLSQITHLVAVANDCSLVAFNGNLVNSSFVQERITYEMKLRNLGSPLAKRVNFGFLKHGGFITAFGSLAAGAGYNIFTEH